MFGGSPANAMAQAHELSGDRPRAVEWLRKAGPAPYVQQRIAQPWNLQDKVYVRLVAMMNVGMYPRAMTIADSALSANVLTDPIVRSQVRYQHGGGDRGNRRVSTERAGDHDPFP